MNNGVFNFNFYDEYDNRLKPKDINKTICENIGLFYDIDETKLKEEMQKTLYVEWNYKLQTITVTLNK